MATTLRKYRRVQPLMSMYLSLRSEIVADVRSTDQIISAIAIVAGAAFTAGYGYGKPVAFTVAGPALLTLGAYWLLHSMGALYLGRYCRFLEQKINQAADDTLLNYESVYTYGTAQFEKAFPHVAKPVHNPFTPLLYLVLAGGLAVYGFFLVQGSVSLCVILRHRYEAWAVPSGILYGLFLLGLTVGVAREYALGLKMTAAMGKSLDKDLADSA